MSRRIEDAMASKQSGDVDIPEVQDLKRVIRETEAVSGIETVGMKAEQARFLDLPFYQTGKVKKDPITEADVDITLQLLEELRPELVFAAGDLSDPHGTHRMCLEAVMRALERYAGPAPELWLYRGAWQEWPVADADVLVPMSEQELRLKKLAIFKHQSQKDRAPFPGPDEREFWQRVEERNRGTAATLAGLGLPAYYAMEAYVVQKDGERVVSPPVPTSALAAVEA
jgi:glucosamine-6-phosphate deaminase